MFELPLLFTLRRGVKVPQAHLRDYPPDVVRVSVLHHAAWQIGSTRWLNICPISVNKECVGKSRVSPARHQGRQCFLGAHRLVRNRVASPASLPIDLRERRKAPVVCPMTALPSYLEQYCTDED
jgi:hypothetical protein